MSQHEIAQMVIRFLVFAFAFYGALTAAAQGVVALVLWSSRVEAKRRGARWERLQIDGIIQGVEDEEIVKDRVLRGWDERTTTSTGTAA